MLRLRFVVLLAACVVAAMASHKCSRYCQTPTNALVCCDPRLPPAAPTPLPATTSSTATSPTATTTTSVHRARSAAQTAVLKGKSVCPSESCPSECMAHDTNSEPTVEELRA
nr:uncharacterized protein LOC113812008 [Penaeus vannamei]